MVHLLSTATPVSSDSRDLHSGSGSDTVAVAFVGSVVPDRPPYQNEAFSRAGNMFQENLLTGIGSAGMAPTIVLSQRPVRSFPGSRTLIMKRGHAMTASGLNIQLVPFWNLPLLRPVTVGIAVLLDLVRWGRRHRHIKRKVVYTYNLTEPSGLFTLIGARLIGARAIVSLNDINIPNETVPATLSRRFDFWIQRKLIRHFDGIVAVTKRMVDDFAPQALFIRVEGGVRAEMFGTELDRPSSLGHDEPFTIMFAGSLDEANGIEELLDAFGILQDPRFRLRIAGAGPLTDRVTAAATKDCRITYHGLLTFDQVLDLYRTADILINMRITKRLNTRYFFPSKMMEYLASGVPVITTCTGHVAEEWADLVFLLHDETAAGLARLIKQVADADPDVRIAKGECAREYMKRHYTWEAQGRRIAEFIRTKLWPTAEVQTD